MSCLVLRMSAVLQSWGETGRFRDRTTATTPTLSGVVGLLAGSLGRVYGSDVSDIASLSMAVRVDSEGRILNDYHTVTVKGVTQLTNRHYLENADFLVVLEGDDEVVRLCADGLTHPVYTPYLGRRSCPPDVPILVGVYEQDTDWCLSNVEFPVDGRERRVVRTVRDGERGGKRPDFPISTGQNHRTFAYREVIEESTTRSSEEFDAFSLMEGTPSCI